MKIVINDVEAFKAVLSFAAKGDVRFYLNGIYIEPELKKVSATNGWAAAYAEIVEESDSEKNVIVTLKDRTIPALTKSLAIRDDCIICYSDKIQNEENRIKIIPTLIVEHDYVNIEKALIPRSEKKAISEIRLNSKLLKTISSLPKDSGTLGFKFINESERVEIEFFDSRIHHVKAFLMPMRP
ncbi:hypothetical protein [Methylophaga sp.]|uniref:hypothetical protein n=1 Tax=Methylophaga sp. TaxID=2024840 RepID=UPI003A930F1C